MATHKFRVGEKVQFLAGQGALLSTTAEIFEIVQQLPERDGEYQYKIKSVDEPHLRVAKESQLRGCRGPARWGALYLQCATSHMWMQFRRKPLLPFRTQCFPVDCVKQQQLK
jgi:hypothetical protein